MILTKILITYIFVYLLECQLWLQAAFVVEDIHIYYAISSIFNITKTYKSFFWFQQLCITMRKTVKCNLRILFLVRSFEISERIDLGLN